MCKDEREFEPLLVVLVGHSSQVLEAFSCLLLTIIPRATPRGFELCSTRFRVAELCELFISGVLEFVVEERQPLLPSADVCQLGEFFIIEHDVADRA